MFDEQTLRAILLAAAQDVPDVAALIVKRWDDIFREESAKVIDLNNPRDRRNGSRGYDASIAAGIAVSQTIAKIKEQTPAHAWFGTEKNALVILRKIGKSIALGDNTMNLAHKSSKHCIPKGNLWRKQC